MPDSNRPEDSDEREQLKNHAARGAVQTFFAKYYATATGMAYGVAMARILDPKDFGLVALAAYDKDVAALTGPLGAFVAAFYGAGFAKAAVDVYGKVRGNGKSYGVSPVDSACHVRPHRPHHRRSQAGRPKCR